MSYSLNSLKGAYIRDYIRDGHRVIKWDTKSFHYSSYCWDCIEVILIEMVYTGIAESYIGIINGL